jgi:hypothetical protein
MSWSVRCTGIRVARAENTSWAYASDWEQFENWCERYGLTLMPGPDKSAAVEYANERIRVAGRRPGPGIRIVMSAPTNAMTNQNGELRP